MWATGLVRTSHFAWPGPRAGSRARWPEGYGTRKGGVSVLTFIRDDEGQGLVEYALIIAVIAIAVIVAMVFLRGQIQNIFSNIGNNLT
jgi:pilus assembly protein Flp/PilA